MSNEETKMEIEIIDIDNSQFAKTLTQFELTGDMEFEFIDEEDISIPERQSKKIDAFFPYGSYSKERTYRDYWSDSDHGLLCALVRIKVIRMNRRGKIAILDDIREFRLLPALIANDLCDDFAAHELKFSVYHN